MNVVRVIALVLSAMLGVLSIAVAIGVAVGWTDRWVNPITAALLAVTFIVLGNIVIEIGMRFGRPTLVIAEKSDVEEDEPHFC